MLWHEYTEWRDRRQPDPDATVTSVLRFNPKRGLVRVRSIVGHESARVVARSFTRLEDLDRYVAAMDDLADVGFIRGDESLLAEGATLAPGGFSEEQLLFLQRSVGPDATFGRQR